MSEMIIAFVKVIYIIFTQHKFYAQLERVLNHDVLQKIGNLKKAYPINKKIKEEINAVMDNNWKTVRKQLKVYLTVYISGLFIYIIPPNVINFYHKFKGTPNYAYIPVGATSFSDDKSMSFPLYYIHLLLDLTGANLAACGSFCFDLLFVIQCIHCTGLIKVLCLMILCSTSDLVPKESRVEYMCCCISHYQNTYEFFKDTQKMFKHVNVSHFLIIMLESAMVLFNINESLESDKLTCIRMVIYYIAAIAMCGVYCYNGQEFTNTSEEISLALNNCLWYEESKEFQKLVQMMLLRTNEELHFDISWFARLSYDTMIKIFKMSYSYFLLLRDISD
ncbi:odorant receptor 63a-like [Eurosta solidaginis]|uniref:odorant receptor 63a-like n=1 Tax=Eurosta solidaginis TaxID=178769 RepID=UPI0035305F25